MHPDLSVLEIPADRKSIPLKDVHDFMHGMALRPLEAERKVYIIRGAEDLADEGANALLKTLEEPPPAVTIILTAPDSHQLLPTIVSRCQVLALRLVPIDEIASDLAEHRGVDAARAEVIARASQGRPGWAILAAEDEELLQEWRQRALDLLELLGASRLDRLHAADRLAERWSGHSEDVREVLEVWVDVWRDAMLLDVGLAGSVRQLDLADRIGAETQRMGGFAIQAALDATLQTADALEHNANPRLALETYVLLLPSLARSS
jgi:DNA polymerase-3 subunit delta'